MQLTQLSDYALRVLMYAAAQAGRLVTIAEVAQVHGISEAHLMKVTHLLSQAGFLETVRGRGGGLRLAREASRIRLGDVVRATEPHLAIVECFGADDRCALSGNCRLAKVLDEALQGFLGRLDASTLQDLVPPRSAALQLHRRLAHGRTAS
jgi:Rrf2 family nitric oxide-sensitive transcriptional repressor